MSWFDRLRGDMEPKVAFDTLSRAWGRSGLEDVLERLCGNPGLRRFLLRFEETPRGFRITSLESEPVKAGGGPPPQQVASVIVPDVERGITELRKALPAPFRFERGAIGLVRDSEGPLDVTLRLDEDGDAFRLSELHQPRGPGVPVDDPAYIACLAAWSEQANRTRGGWKMCRADQRFAIDGHRLTLSSEPAGAAGEAEREAGESESLVVTVLGTWNAPDQKFTWLLDKPVSTEAPFVNAELTLSLGQVTELMAVAAARLGAMGVFQGDVSATRPGEAVTVFAAIR